MDKPEEQMDFLHFTITLNAQDSQWSEEGAQEYAVAVETC